MTGEDPVVVVQEEIVVRHGVGRDGRLAEHELLREFMGDDG